MINSTINSVVSSLKVCLSIIFIFMTCEPSEEYPGYCTEKAGSLELTGNLGTPALHPGGKMIYFGYFGNTYDTDPVGVFTLDLQSGELDSFITGYSLPGYPDDIAFSPDGKWLAFGSAQEIWIIKINGDSLQRLTTGGRHYYPRWSPDGKKITYGKSVEPESGTWILDLETGKTRLLKHWGGRSHWHPDGTKLVCSLGGEDYELIQYGINGRTLFTLANKQNLGYEIGAIKPGPYSPGGSKILFSALEPGKSFQVYVMDVEEKRPIPLAIGFQAVWSPNETEIVYALPAKDSGGIWIMDSDGCNKRPLILTDDFQVWLRENIK